jgi:transposase
MPRFSKGSHPKLTIELVEEISLSIRRGCYIESAAALAEISKDTFYRWLRNAKKDSATDLESLLSDAVLKSMAEAEMKDIEVIDKAANGCPDKLALDENGNLILDSQGNPIILEYGLPPNWKAAAWRLERKFPERWGSTKKIRADITMDEPSNKIHFVDAPSSV